MRGELHRSDLAVEKQLVGGGHVFRRGGGGGGQRSREVELEGASGVRGGGGGGRVGFESGGGEHEMHGAGRGTVVKSSEVRAAAGAGRGADVGGGAAAIHLVEEFFVCGGGGVLDLVFHSWGETRSCGEWWLLNNCYN